MLVQHNNLLNFCASFILRVISLVCLGQQIMTTKDKFPMTYSWETLDLKVQPMIFPPKGMAEDSRVSSRWRTILPPSLK